MSRARALRGPSLRAWIGRGARAGLCAWLAAACVSGCKAEARICPSSRRRRRRRRKRSRAA